MTILDRANAFIGHEQEVDEGYETTMRRNAFIAGFKEALGLVRKMREARRRYSALSREFCSKGMKPRQSWGWQEARKLTKRFESEVDELIKEME